MTKSREYRSPLRSQKEDNSFNFVAPPVPHPTDVPGITEVEFYKGLKYFFDRVFCKRMLKIDQTIHNFLNIYSK